LPNAKITLAVAGPSIDASGRIAYLVADDGVGLQERALICSCLDWLDGKRAFDLPQGEEVWQ
jgi:hypothetical protein